MTKISVIRSLGTGMLVGAVTLGTTSCSKVCDLLDNVTSFFSGDDDDKLRAGDSDDDEMVLEEDTYDIEAEEEPDADFDMDEFRRQAAATNAAAQAAADKSKNQHDVAAKTKSDTKSSAPSEVKAHTVTEPVAEAIPAEKPAEDNSTVGLAQVEQKPAFPGGDAAMYNWINENLNYPASAAEEGVSGRVIVQFIVERDGSISNVKVVRGKHPALDAEAKRVVSKMPKWIPGRMNGKIVRVTYVLPINFKLTQ